MTSTSVRLSAAAVSMSWAGDRGFTSPHARKQEASAVATPSYRCASHIALPVPSTACTVISRQDIATYLTPIEFHSGLIDQRSKSFGSKQKNAEKGREKKGEQKEKEKKTMHNAQCTMHNAQTRISPSPHPMHIQCTRIVGPLVHLGTCGMEVSRSSYSSTQHNRETGILWHACNRKGHRRNGATVS